MATTVIFADAADDFVRGTDAVYATARQVGSSIPGPAGLSLQCGQFFTTAYGCDEALISFDTSTAGTPVTAELRVVGSNDSSTAADFTLEARLHDWGTAVEVADFVAGDDLAGKTLLATLTTVGFLVGSSPFGVNIFTDVDMAANVNTAGFTRMVLASDRQRTAVTPTGLELVAIRSANTIGTADDPRLTITDATVPLSAPQGRMFHVIP